MGKTIAEKILSEKAGKDVVPDEIGIMQVDLTLAQDGTGPLSIRQMKEMGIERLANPERTVFFIDHAAPSPRKELSNEHKLIREFAARTGAVLSDIGGGVCHQVINEKFSRPGDLLVGADSHTCTAGALGCFGTGMGSTDIAVAMALGKTWLRVPQSMKVVLKGSLLPGVMAKDLVLNLIGRLGADGATYMALEFAGNVAPLPQSERFTIANMAVEAGAKAGLFPTDEVTRAFLEEMGRGNDYREIVPDEDACYAGEVAMRLDELVPQVAFPHTVDNVRTIDETGEVEINQVFLGSCTNGRLDDIRAFSDLVEGRQKAEGVRVLVTPASRSIYMQAMSEGLLQRLMDFGAVVLNPGCGICVGVHMGALADRDRCISTSNRNFKGRMGNPEGEIYLASPLTCAASAIEGRIADPRRYIG